MKIHAFYFLIYFLIQGCYCDSDLPIGYKVKVAIPNLYSSGFIGKAFILETDTDQKGPNFKAAITVEAMDEAYSCSLEIFLGDFKVWSSGHLLKFYTSDTCNLELTQSGDLQLSGYRDRLGWRSATPGQGVKSLQLLKMGNLILVDEMGLIKWQSFNFPTDVMLWDQSLSSRTRLTSFINNSTLYYSFEIHSDKLALYLNYDKWKYSYWELNKSSKEQNITFVKLTSNALEIFTGYDKKIAQITSKKGDPLSFLALGNVSGNLGLYYYSRDKQDFEPYYQALKYTCDFPLACKPYEICTFSNSCSCLRLITKETESLDDCSEGRMPEGLCGGSQAEMLKLHGVTSVLRSTPTIMNVSQETCANLCLDDCTCAAALYLSYEDDDDDDDSDIQECCYLYGFITGVKQVTTGSRTIFMVKVPKGSAYLHHGKGYGLKKWVVIVIGVVDGFIVVVVIGGTSYYIMHKRKNNSIDAGHPP